LTKSTVNGHRLPRLGPLVSGFVRMASGAGVSDKRNGKRRRLLFHQAASWTNGPRPTACWAGVEKAGPAVGSRAAVWSRSSAALAQVAACVLPCGRPGSSAVSVASAPCGPICTRRRRTRARRRFAGGDPHLGAPRASAGPTLGVRGVLVRKRAVLGVSPWRRRLGREGRRRFGATKRALRAISARMCSLGLSGSEDAAVVGARARTRRKRPRLGR
jgi:hypothetical protein